MNRLAIYAAVAALVSVPAAAMAAEQPDFTGVWSIVGYSPSLKPADGKPVPLKPEAKAEYEEHLAMAAKGDHSWDETTICLPQGLPRLMLVNKPFQIMQRPKGLFFLHQENRMPRRAFYDQKIEDDADPMYLGFSSSRWEGQTLVIESKGFREGTFLDDKGLPHSDVLKLTERYRLGRGGKTINATYVIDDPKTYTRTWTAKASFAKKPASFEIPEEVCADKLASTAPKR